MRFYKLSGTGNDFIIIDNRNKIFPEKNRDILVVKMCERNKGIGADGLILIENTDAADYEMVFYNNDGSRAEMCGNGGRCLGYIANYLGIVGKKHKFKSLSGIHEVEVDGEYVNLELIVSAKSKDGNIEIDNKRYEYTFINTGVPHVVILSDDIEKEDVKNIGRQIRYNNIFNPNGTNVNFVFIKDRKNVLIRTYERGVEDETLACGTGSTASALALYEKGLVDLPVNMHTKGGDILIIDKEGERVFLKGKVDFIYTADTGKYYENDFSD